MKKKYIYRVEIHTTHTLSPRITPTNALNDEEIENCYESIYNTIKESPK